LLFWRLSAGALDGCLEQHCGFVLRAAPLRSRQLAQSVEISR
jgi:hypothetical protein